MAASSRRLNAAVLSLLGTILAILIGLEVFTRVVVEHGSQVQAEVNQEFQDALEIKHSADPHGREVLLVGNSLVGHGIDMQTLQGGLAPDWHVHRLWIYNTGYQDWYFGLRKILAEGSRPDVVAVVFGAMHWYSNDIRGEYAAQYMFQTADLPQISDQLHLSRTAGSSLLFARYSKFFALRSEIRKVLLHSLIPDLPQMYALFEPASRHHVADQTVESTLTKRIEAYKAIVESYGSSLVLVVPPIPRPRDEHQNEIRAAAQRAGVRIIMPVSSKDVPASYFADDVHLNGEGARFFSESVAKAFDAVITHPALANSPGTVALNK